MKRKLIKDWKTVTKQEMFLYLLQGRLLHFFHVDDREAVQFAKFCVDYGLLKYKHTKEFRGTPAEFDVLKDFNIQWKPQHPHQRNPNYVYTMEAGHCLAFTEFLEPAARDGNTWFREVDVPTGENRRKYYEWAKELLCK